ncbi:glycoside hydrolase family 5 protein [Botryobasidium botryosum FD-172 SS1]|uniref:Glycoside hydrolase family 5 protein n=1 Tax=Botryobasidium botryosum (strain FD-172 SS1) TaxID=930990 RepID=A0A067MGJ1_BOTB1|nr:glycoside hydrolase family 5 protein [Botryobasidium botryosum FD-172 SS1]
MLFKHIALLAASTWQTARAFTPTSAATAWKSFNPGWNLGNTLDALPTEGSWNNPPVVNATWDDIVASGFKSVRIPITFNDHYISDAPNYTIDPVWLTRINTVVDAALSRGLWAIVNVHHDSWNWADLSNNPADLNAKKTKFEKTWVQLAGLLKSKSEKLVFESLNEPVGSTLADAAQYNDLNARFINVLINSGGNNAQRIISLPGLGDNSVYLTDWFKYPGNWQADKWGVQFHYYSPWDFGAGWWGRTFWGSAEDKAAVTSDFAQVKGNFSVPVLVGEYGTSLVGRVVEKAAGWAWYDHVVRTGIKNGFALQFWDNGEYFNRATHQWTDVTTKNIIVAASAGQSNTIPENGYGTIWIKSGATLAAQALPLQYNGNTLKGVYSGTTALKSGTDYTVTTNPTGISLTTTYLKTIVGKNLGALGTLTIKSSSGADLEIDIRQYSVPTIDKKAYTVTAASDLSIPVKFNGAKLATVKAIKADGTILKDDWTQWLGPLQAGRVNWSDDFDFSGDNLVAKASLLNAIKSSGSQPVTLTWEFWPRTDAANNVVTTVSVS